MTIDEKDDTSFCFQRWVHVHVLDRLPFVLQLHVIHFLVPCPVHSIRLLSTLLSTHFALRYCHFCGESVEIHPHIFFSNVQKCGGYGEASRYSSFISSSFSLMYGPASAASNNDEEISTKIPPMFRGHWSCRYFRSKNLWKRRKYGSTMLLRYWGSQIQKYRIGQLNILHGISAISSTSYKFSQYWENREVFLIPVSFLYKRHQTTYYFRLRFFQQMTLTLIPMVNLFNENIFCNSERIWSISNSPLSSRETLIRQLYEKNGNGYHSSSSLLVPSSSVQMSQMDQFIYDACRAYSPLLFLLRDHLLSRRSLLIQMGVLYPYLIVQWIIQQISSTDDFRLLLEMIQISISCIQYIDSKNLQTLFSRFPREIMDLYLTRIEMACFVEFH